MSAEQLTFDPLVPRGREKFSLREVAVILGSDGQPLSIRTVRAMLESGQLGGYRLPLSARPGEVERIKHELVTADDLILYLLRHRTLERGEHLARLLRLIDGLTPAEIDQLLKHAVAARTRKATR